MQITVSTHVYRVFSFRKKHYKQLPLLNRLLTVGSLTRCDFHIKVLELKEGEKIFVEPGVMYGQNFKQIRKWEDKGKELGLKEGQEGIFQHEFRPRQAGAYKMVLSSGTILNLESIIDEFGIYNEGGFHINEDVVKDDFNEEPEPIISNSLLGKLIDTKTYNSPISFNVYSANVNIIIKAVWGVLGAIIISLITSFIAKILGL